MNFMPFWMICVISGLQCNGFDITILKTTVFNPLAPAGRRIPRGPYADMWESLSPIPSPGRLNRLKLGVFIHRVVRPPQNTISNCIPFQNAIQ